jgi:hypothetical protein
LSYEAPGHRIVGLYNRQNGGDCVESHSNRNVIVQPHSPLSSPSHTLGVVDWTRVVVDSQSVTWLRYNTVVMCSVVGRSTSGQHSTVTVPDELLELVDELLLLVEELLDELCDDELDDDELESELDDELDDDDDKQSTACGVTRSFNSDT